MTSQLNYTEVLLVITPVDAGREILVAELAEIGFESFEYSDNGMTGWLRSELFDVEKVNEIIVRYAPLFMVTYDHHPVKPVNWNEEWEKNYDPVVIDSRCRIRAPFHPPMNNFEFEIVIEPKMSFGTAHHDTTALMIRWLLDTDTTSLEVLDMGCGTGVLAILAAMKGAVGVTAVDNYIWACENTIENSQRNNIFQPEVIHGDAEILTQFSEKFHLILANINRNVIVEDLSKFTAALAPDGQIILSGFLEVDKETVSEEAFRCQLHFLGEKIQNQWVSMAFIKKQQ
jgi:ribosomal protein L11 methyltransferase